MTSRERVLSAFHRSDGKPDRPPLQSGPTECRRFRPSGTPKKLRRQNQFFSGIDRQELMPSGDIEKLDAEIRRRARIMGSNGNYLMAPAHIIQVDVAPETVEAMIESVQSLA